MISSAIFVHHFRYFTALEKLMDLTKVGKVLDEDSVVKLVVFQKSNTKSHILN